MAKITFERSGGFLEPLVSFQLDLDTLPPDASQHLLYLIEDADFFRLPENLDTTHSVDEFSYSITVETSASQHSIHVSEMNVPDALLPLITELSTAAVFG